MLSAYKTELKPFEDLARSFAAGELSGKAEEHDRFPFGDFFQNVLEKAHETGFLGVMLPEKLGGIGGDISTLSIILMNICRADASLGAIIFTNALSQTIMLAAGAEEIMTDIFPRASSCRDLLVAFPSFTDPACVDALPRAERSGNGYSISGALDYLVLGGIASHAIIPARSKDAPGYSFFLVNSSDSGMTRGDAVFSLGLHACPAVDIALESAEGILIGEEGKGKAYFREASSKMHAAAGAMNAGIMQGSFSEALAYAKERTQGGWEIINWSEVSMLLSGMSIKADVAGMCVAQACLELENGLQDAARRTVSAALHIHELAGETVTDGIQILGGNGYMKDYGQEKRFRDAHQVQALLGASPLKKLDLIRRRENP